MNVITVPCRYVRSNVSSWIINEEHRFHSHFEGISHRSSLPTTKTFTRVWISKRPSTSTERIKYWFGADRTMFPHQRSIRPVNTIHRMIQGMRDLNSIRISRKVWQLPWTVSCRITKRKLYHNWRKGKLSWLRHMEIRYVPSSSIWMELMKPPFRNWISPPEHPWCTN